MTLLGRSALNDFIQKHADAKSWIENWIADVEAAAWGTPQDIKNKYASASFLHDCVTIFNVKGNRYRLETIVAFKTRVVTVKWVGTHAEYDKKNK